MFTNFEETKNWIETIKKFGSRLDLSRITKVLRMFDHPETKYPAIHVAGTNGKGSTASYLKNILVEAGYKVGLYTSPYIVKFNERIVINNEFITDEDIIKYTNIVYPVWEEMYQTGETITFFEVLTIICFLYFRDQLVDYAVIEVGLGGLLDATNVVKPEITVITNISYDHMNVLGSTLESIALNKLGIVKPNTPLVTSVENEKLFPLFQEITLKNKSELTIIDFTKVSNISLSETTKFSYKGEDYEASLPGYHQVKNAVLAIETIQVLNGKNHLNISVDHIKMGLKKTKWPGRFEIFNHNIILDGAHNIGGIEALQKTVSMMYPNKSIKCLVSIMYDKEHQKIIEILDNMCDAIYFTEFEYERRAEAQQLFNESNHKNKKIYKDYKSIFLQLTNLRENEILIVTGSLYFISEIRKLLIK